MEKITTTGYNRAAWREGRAATRMLGTRRGLSYNTIMYDRRRLPACMHAWAGMAAMDKRRHVASDQVNNMTRSCVNYFRRPL